MQRIARTSEIACVALLALLIALPFVQVVARDVWGAAIVGAEELSRFLLIALVFASFPLVVRAGENIVMGEIQDALPRPLRRAARLAVSVGGVLTCGFMAYVGFANISDNLRNHTPTLGIPFWIFLGFTAVGFAGAGLVHLIHLRRPPRAATNVTQ